MFKNALGIQSTQLPWLQGAFSIANGLSVILSGSLTDLLRPKALIVGAFAWLAVWNCVGAFSIAPSRNILFFIVRGLKSDAVAAGFQASHTSKKQSTRIILAFDEFTADLPACSA